MKIEANSRNGRSKEERRLKGEEESKNEKKIKMEVFRYMVGQDS